MINAETGGPNEEDLYERMLRKFPSKMLDGQKWCLETGKMVKATARTKLAEPGASEPPRSTFLESLNGSSKLDSLNGSSKAAKKVISLMNLLQIVFFFVCIYCTYLPSNVQTNKIRKAINTYQLTSDVGRHVRRRQHGVHI